MPHFDWEAVRRLRREGRRARGLADDGPPPGGWHPIFDDDGNVIPDPPPDEPTDVPADVVDAARPPDG